MVNLSVTLDPAQVAAINKRCANMDPAKVNAALRRAAKRAADAAKTETKKQLAAQYTLPSGEIGQTIKTRAGKGAGAGAVMQITSSPNALPKFKGTKPAKPPAPQAPAQDGRKQRKRKTQKVKVEVKKGSGSTFDRAFPAKMQSGHIGIFNKKSAKRLPISEKFGPATTGMVKANEAVNEPVVKRAKEILDKRVEHEIGRLIGGK